MPSVSKFYPCLLIVLFLALSIAAPGPARASFSESADFSGVFYESAAWGDYDNDGYLDLLLTGLEGSDPVTKIYHNNGDGSFSDSGVDNLTGVSVSSAAWGDYDNDGYIDILLAGWDGSGTIAKIHHNNGDGSFSDSGVDNLTGVRLGSAAWGDYDNDGYLDILLTGFNSGTIAKIYRNNGDGSFSDSGVDNLTGVDNSSAAWGDYDNDGYLDILLTGYHSGPIAKIYHNDGDGSFSDSGVDNLTKVSKSSVAWGDYDNDGYLDILLAGSDDPNPIVKIYHNDGDGSFSDSGVNNLTGVKSSSAAWGDYDNDGYLDILLTGSDDTNSIAKIYRNNGDGSFSDSDYSTTWAYLYSAAWGDYDNDGDLDFLITGSTGPAGFAKIYQNDCTSADTPPNAPTGLNAAVENDVVTLSWEAASDAETPAEGLTYNIRMGTASDGIDVVSPMADLTTGWRRIPAMGGAGHRLFAMVRGVYPYTKTYFWSVQAVDSAFEGSPWATQGYFGAVEDLVVVLTGNGSGAVTSDPAGIDCGDSCLFSFPPNHSVTLSAAADSESVFVGWEGGACSGAGDCILTMDATKVAVAHFEKGVAYSLSVATNGGNGTGRVTSAPDGIDCGTSCQASFTEGAAVTLSATPDAGYAFNGWSSDACPGNGDCTLTLGADTSVTAAFDSDADGDGIADEVENAGPNNGDANADAALDSVQNQVATFQDIYGRYVTLSIEDGTLEGATAAGLPAAVDIPAGQVFPYGFFGFNITGLNSGASVQATLILHEKDDSLTTYYRYGPTPDNTDRHWYEFIKGEGTVGATVTQEETASKIMLSLTDGQTGDDDLSADGIITDIGGPARTESVSGTGGGGGGGGQGCFLEVLE